LYDIFSTTDTNDITRVQSGLNTYTGGTANSPTVNVSALTINNIAASGTSFFTGGLSANTLSGGTLYSGSTNLYDIFLTTNDGNDITRVQPGSNTTTGGTENNPIVNVVSSPSFNSITASGSSNFNGGLSANTLSGGTILSGNTDIYNVFLNKVTAGSNVSISGTSTSPIVNVVISPSFSDITFSGTAIGVALSATSISAATSIYSAGTSLETIIYNIASATENVTSIGNGLNTYTGGSQTTPTINVSAATLASLAVSGTTILNTLSAITISANTIYSANTDIYNIFVNKVNAGSNISIGGTSISPIVNVVTSPTFNDIAFSGTATGGNLFATNLSGGSIFSGNTNLQTTFNLINSQVDTKANLSGATFTGAISATTYYGLPIDVYVTGGTYSAGTAVFTNNTGGTFNVTGFNTGLTNSLSSGVYIFTGITTASTTTFTISPVSGLIIDGTSDPLTPAVLPVYYSGGTHTVINLSSATETYILLSSGATIFQQTTFPTDIQRRQNIFLGKIGHANKTSIINVFNQPDFLQYPLAQLRDMFQPIRFVNDGVYPSPNGANLSFNTSAGEIHGLGINYVNNTLKPNSLTVAGQSPVTFQYRTQTGGTDTNTTNIIPGSYDLGGVITAIGLPAKQATNQRIYLLQNGQIRIQYGQTVYIDLTTAVSSLQSELFTTFINFKDNAVLIGILSLRSDATNLSDSNYARFIPASKFGELLGGTLGLSTTTLQQAYDNSTNPEIMTNSTLDGVQFRGGTGSDLDANIIIENNAGTQTGAWYANGNLIAKNLTATTLSATTISGGTLYSGSTNLYNIFAPINSSPYRTFVLTAGTTFSFTGTVNTVSVNKTTGSATQINLPSSPVINDYFVVKDRKGDSKINPITISGGTITIDGNVSYQMKANNNPSLTFLFDGSEYIVI
jgi:hypothetical protein